MSMTGGISFYDKSKSLFSDGATCAASSNTADQNLCLGTNKYFRWQSDGSNDSTIETLTVTLPAATAISRMFLVGMNFKAFQIQYGNGIPADFTNVTGLDSYSNNEINVTGFSRDAAYFEFTEVTTDTIIITVNTTQTANAEKYINQIILTNELGTLVGYPGLSGVKLDRNDEIEKAITGRAHVEKGYESVSFDLRLRTYPGQDDINLLDSLHDREGPFLVWLCGGKPDQFTFKQRGFRVQDIYQMKIDDALNNSYERNVYLMGVNQRYSFMEVV